MTYRPVFVNAGNPQLQLLAYFLTAMLNTNEEATSRVFGTLRIERRAGVWSVYGPTNGVDIMITPSDVDEIVPEMTEERIMMLTDIWNKIKELNK